MKRIIVIICQALLCIASGAQPIAPNPAFRTGRLENGMSYYLYHNENPAGCADFYIAHNVGALQEEDNQNGLAHFLEHMAFNGLRHYPGKSMLEFLAGEGVRFGYNVNAFTSRKETVYNISSVPLVREGFVDSVMTILHDWSCDISCEQQALDDERGVINEEWRLRDEPRYRMMCRQTELVYKGAKHPERTVLGSMDVVLNFKREEILDFYHKWYRPDLQAIIIAGDFDVDEMEMKVKEKFSDIEMPENAPVKPSSYMPPRLQEPMYADMTDPSIKYQVVKIIFRQQYPEDVCCEEYYRDYFGRQIVSAVIGNRMKERCAQKECPANSIVFVTSESAPEFYISLATISPKKKENMEGAMRVALEEIRRIQEHGISEMEMEVAKLNLTQKFHLDREIHPEDIKTDQISKICYHNFLDSAPLLDPVENASLLRRTLSEVRYEDMGKYISEIFSESDVIYSNCINENELDNAIPHDRMKEIVAEVAASQTEERFLEYGELDMTISSEPGSIVSRSKAGDVSVWKLSNGATVYIRHADAFKSDTHLAMKIDLDGGMRAFDPGNFASDKYAASYFKRFAGFRNTEKDAFKNHVELMGITDNIDIYKDKTQLDIRVNSLENVENAFKLVNLQFTEPCFPKESHLEKEKNATLKNLARTKSARELFRIRAKAEYLGDNPWNVELDSACVQAVDMERVKNLYKRCLAARSSMRVMISSDAPESALEEYVCKYIASLTEECAPALEKARPMVCAIKGEKRVSETNPPVSAPLCEISYEFVWDAARTAKLKAAVQILGYILSNRYLDLIREERGGAYHVAFTTDYTFDKSVPLSSYVEFQTRPELREILCSDVENVIAQFSKEGPTQEEMETAKKYFLKYDRTRKAQAANSAMMRLDQLTDFVKYGAAYDYDYPALLDKIDSNCIRKTAARIERSRRFIMVYSEE